MSNQKKYDSKIQKQNENIVWVFVNILWDFSIWKTYKILLFVYTIWIQTAYTWKGDIVSVQFAYDNMKNTVPPFKSGRRMGQNSRIVAHVAHFLSTNNTSSFSLFDCCFLSCQIEQMENGVNSSHVFIQMWCTECKLHGILL